MNATRAYICPRQVWAFAALQDASTTATTRRGLQGDVAGTQEAALLPWPQEQRRQKTRETGTTTYEPPRTSPRDAQQTRGGGGVRL